MKITQESPSRMVLKDNNITGFIGGLVFMAVGIGLSLLSYSESLIAAGVGVIFALAGLYIVLSTRIVTAVLDKGTGKGTFSFWGVVKRESRDIELARMKELVLAKNARSSSKGGTTYEYIITFALTSGEEIPLELGSVGAGIADVVMSPDEKKKAEANLIAGFLGVPMRFVGAPSVMEALSAIKEGIAEGMERTAKKSGEQP